MSIKTFFLSLVIAVATVSAAVAQTTVSASDTLTAIVGKWTGTYEGSDLGNFELNLNKDSNSKLTGQIVMLPPDGNRYPIDLKTVVWQNGQLSASYTDPSGGNDVSFSGRLTNPTMKGTWEAGGGQAAGTWQLKRADK